jgi:hypothetical protein
MTANPSRATADGAIYLDIQNKARKDKRPTDELLVLYTLEGFLARLANSTYADVLVLKGGVLMAAYAARRPTRDVDLQARDLSNDANHVLGLVRTIATIAAQDGLVFDAAGATAEVIRDDDEYTGVRVSLKARLATAKITFHVDVNVGDPITPEPQTVQLPRLLGGSVELRGYPLPMVHAEKIITAVSRGTANTRWRDFGDIYILARAHPVDAVELAQSIATVAAHRQVALAQLADALDGYAELAQARWASWRRRQKREEDLPASFAEVLDTVAAFADPVLSDAVTSGTWDPAALTWT